jgi:hypothetical protein
MEISEGIPLNMGANLIGSEFAPTADKKYLYPPSKSNIILY